MSDPPVSTPLSAIDQAKLIIQYCSNAIAEERKYTNEIIREEREHTYDQIKVVAEGLGKSVEHLKTALVEKIATCDLKLDTFSSYQEQLLYSLKKGFQDALHNIESDMQSILRLAHPCTFCANSFDNLNDLKQHVLNNHSASLPSNPHQEYYMDSTTGLTPSLYYAQPLHPYSRPPHVLLTHNGQHHPPHHQAPKANLQQEDHSAHYTACSPEKEGNVVEQYQHGHQIYYCYQCGLPQQSEETLALHMEYLHYTQVHCSKCDFTCHDIRLLNVHIREYHQKEPTNTVSPGSNDTSSNICHKCDQTFLTYADLAEHSRTNHPLQMFLQCEVCAETFTGITDLNTHTRIKHTLEEFAQHPPIPQFDGNEDTDVSVHSMEVGNVRLNHLEENETRRLISTTGGTTDSAQQSKHQDFSYNYGLNHQKQIQRLFTNAN